MSDEDRLARAAELEDQARTEPLAKARELGMQAAQLRMRVLGEKPYPVLVCSECWQLTGWLGSRDRCDVCISSDRREASFADPSGSWVALHGEASPAPARRVSAWKRLTAALGARNALERERMEVWNERVDPGESGPPTPEDGFVVFGADRGEWPAPEGTDLLVRFTTFAYRFEDHGWHHTVQRGGPVPLTPHVFPASLPFEQIAEAWSDYCDEVRRFNCAVWAEEAERRDLERRQAQAVDEARREQAGTSGLLDDRRE